MRALLFDVVYGEYLDKFDETVKVNEFVTVTFHLLFLYRTYLLVTLLHYLW